MSTRRHFLTSVFSVGVVGLIAACSGTSGTLSTTSATSAPAAAAGGAAPTQAAPAQVTAKPAAAGGSVTFAIENDIIDFDPLVSRAFVDRNAHYQIYDSLVRIDTAGKIIPWLATKWDTSADGKQVTFSLRTDVKYHDGTDFDAASVKWNIDRYRTADGSARSGELAPVASVEVVDPATVRFDLSTPYAPLLATLVDRAGMMVSQKAAEAGGADFTRKAFKAGTGPFILTEAIKDDHTTLEKNPSWWGTDQAGNKLPYLDKITIKPITDADVRLTNVKTGDAHMINNVSFKDVNSLKTDNSLNYQEKASYEWNSLVTNRKDGFVFNEGRYVKAVAMAIDRQELLQKAFFGIGSVGYGTIAPSHFAADPNFKPYPAADPDGAKQLVQAVGKGPLSFEMLVPSADASQLQQAQLIQAQLKKADIDAQIVQLEFAQILDQQSKHTYKGAAYTGWSGRIDPDGNTYDFVFTNRPNNDTSYSNPDVDKLLDEQRANTDQNARKDSLRKAEQIYVVDDPARVWFRFSVSQLLTVPALKGLEPYPDRIARFQFGTLNK
jgi:peptide/nickel transport system substrate-binding protein